MSIGFFPRSQLTLSKPPPQLMARCGLCGLCNTCLSPKMDAYGEGRRKILVLGEAPGLQESRQGRPFVGPVGQLLRETIAPFGIDLDRDCLSFNSLSCHPPNDRVPNEKMIDWCRPRVLKVIEDFKPETIILLGGRAVRSVIGWLWREDPGKIGRWAGFQIPAQRTNSWVCPTWHPSYILRSRKEAGGRTDGVLDLIWRQHLESAFSLSGRPWKKVPFYAGEVKVILNAEEATKILDRMTEAKRLTALDIESDRLKPDREDSRIVSCAVSDGETTISYPWHGSVIEATKRMIRSDTPLIASNLKFESLWFMKHLGCRVKNWRWDTMLSAHILDNRGSISSIKFQAFALLGQDSWDAHIKPFFKSKGANEPNRIREIGIGDLLLYGGLDSLMEYHVAVKQMKKMGVSCA